MGAQGWYMASVLVAFGAVLARAYQLAQGRYPWLCALLAVCLCWTGPVAAVGALALHPSAEWQMRRRAERAELEARLAWAEWDRRRAEAMLGEHERADA